jgi:hypothetical protein
MQWLQLKTPYTLIVQVAAAEPGACCAHHGHACTPDTHVYMHARAPSSLRGVGPALLA